MAEIEYELIRSRRKTISIMISHDASVVVRAPLRAPKAEIAGFVSLKRKWIIEKRTLVQQRSEAHKPGEYTNGEEFLYLGRRLMLAISGSVQHVEAVGDTLAFPKAELACAQASLKRWYVAEAARILAERVEYWSRRTGIAAASAGVTGARRRWGSCSATGSLNFAWRLVMAPMEVIDYVVVHELAHIEHLNHSKAFWGRVGEILPDYKVKLKWLKDNNAILKLF
jgi:predicted metal-dependent hydrolase